MGQLDDCLPPYCSLLQKRRETGNRVAAGRAGGIWKAGGSTVGEITNLSFGTGSSRPFLPRFRRAEGVSSMPVSALQGIWPIVLFA